jgi:hypothetical protein
VRAASRVILSVLLFCAGALPLFAQFFYDESCRNATGAITLVGTYAGYTASAKWGNIDPVGDGWLRLTNTSASNFGYVFSKDVISTV